MRVRTSCSVDKLSCWRASDGTRFILPWAAAGKVPSLYKLGVVDHPKAAEVVLVPDETLVQRQIRADCVLHFGGAEDRKRKGKEGKISSSSSNLVVEEWLLVVGGSDSNGHMYTFGEIKQTNHLVRQGLFIFSCS